jgi:hypothetical protein
MSLWVGSPTLPKKKKKRKKEKTKGKEVSYGSSYL